MLDFQHIHTCIDRLPTTPDRPIPPQNSLSGRGGAASDDMASLSRPAIDTTKMWSAGQRLHVRFLDGDPMVQQKVEKFAHEWSRYGNIHFDFGDKEDADIRITFEYPGSWSFIGKDAQQVPLDQPTMNFGWLTKATPNDEYQRVVLHEFGHALGLIHEHQNPSNKIPWNTEAVYEFYNGAPNFWTRDQVDTNLFQRYDASVSQFSEFDPKSIMLYPISRELTIGGFEVGFNKGLSEMDKQYINEWYPFYDIPDNTLQVDGISQKVTISEPAQVNEFMLHIERKSLYTIETTGSLDLVMSVFASENSKLVAEDEDSGWLLNPQIRYMFDVGTYRVRVHHVTAEETGEYSISARKGT